MKKSYDESYKYIGQVIQIEDCESVPNGTVALIVEHSNDCDLMYFLKDNVTDILCDEYNFTIIPTPPKERLELMYEGLVNHTMTLIAEGWSKENPYMDISPWLIKLGILEELLNSNENT